MPPSLPKAHASWPVNYNPQGPHLQNQTNESTRFYCRSFVYLIYWRIDRGRWDYRAETTPVPGALTRCVCRCRDDPRRCPGAVCTGERPCTCSGPESFEADYWR